jgi:hypothetical protein
MSKSRRKYPITSDTAKESFKSQYNSALRSKNRDLINKFLKGDINEEELQFAEDPNEVSDIWASPVEDCVYYRKPQIQHNFSDEHTEEEYLENMEWYEKSFRK